MVIAIQQPEHLPWVGFFNKMAQCDFFVYLDNVQFKKRYFENRNKIKTKNEVKWLTVPVHTKGKFTQNINQVIIDNESQWTKKYIGMLEHSYKKFPYWNEVEKIVIPCIEENREKLIDVNLALIEGFRTYLRIETPTTLASSIGLDQVSGGDLILEICHKTKAKVYVSGPDGRNYLNLKDFNSNSISVIYHDFVHPVYPQLYGEFMSHMSVIDLVANCGPESEKIVKDCYSIKKFDEL